jgi:hypothetical protein
LFAEHQRRQAEEQTTLAISRELAAQASLARASPEDGLVRSTLLAIESLRRRPTLEGQTALMADVPLLRHRIARLAHDGVVAAVAFSPNGTRLATASLDKTARLWEAAGRQLARLAIYGEVSDVAFSPDGAMLATAGPGPRARLWLCRTEDLIAAACRCLERNLTRDEWHQYLGEAPYHATCPDLPLPGASQ